MSNDELEYEGFDAAGCFESEPLHVKPRHDEFIEVAYECRKQKKYRVLAHEGFWKPVPAESVVHVIEDALLPSTEVIEFNNLFLGRLVIICKDAAVGVFAFS